MKVYEADCHDRNMQILH